MQNFKQLFLQKSHNFLLENPSTHVEYEGHTLYLRFDNRDVVMAASYTGNTDPWLSSLCELVKFKTLNEANQLTFEDWKKVFKDDQSFWEMLEDSSHDVFFVALEMLKVALNIFRGRDYLYEKMSPLICRCFGIREADVLDHMKKEEHPTVESLGISTKAGMGCRSCVSQLNRWLVTADKAATRHFKGRSIADWLLMIDASLVLFPRAQEWKMEIESFKSGQVIISFDKDTSQKEEEEMGRKLQGFLASDLDSDLSFFLRRSRQR